MKGKEGERQTETERERAQKKDRYGGEEGGIKGRQSWEKKTVIERGCEREAVVADGGGGSD